VTIVIEIGVLRLVAAAVEELKIVVPKSANGASDDVRPFETVGVSTIHSAEVLAAFGTDSEVE
jgi:hypothetical protein